MVDSIKNLGSSGARPTTSSLRSSFKSLSTAAVKQAPSGATAADESERGNRILSDLNEAVSYSSKAVKSLEEISAAAAGTDAAPVDQEDLARLRDDIDRVKSKVDVASENMRSAGSRLEDVDAAQSHAVKTGFAINFASTDAMDAHNLKPQKVAELLFE